MKQLLFNYPPKIDIQIELQESSVILRGDPQDCLGAVLRGAVIVNVTEPTRVRSIYARFRGRMRIWWSEGE
jgi:hypothetical protein